MFPHVVQPLHIFEPRYCDLLEDAIAGDRKIAIVLLEPGWERDYYGRPPICSVACLGKIVAHERLRAPHGGRSGRHNILLRGLSRVVVRRELPGDTSFRRAEVELVDDMYPPGGAQQRWQAKRRLVDLARKLLPDSDALEEQLSDLLAGQASLGMLTDVFAFTLAFSPAVKQQLLAEPDVDQRAALLAERLSALAGQLDGAPAAARFPPRFSLN
jgi:ATP-dependent Lon protease